jgi:hypothetical protein
VIPLHGGGVAGTPLASEVEVVSALSSNVAFADMFLCRQVSSFPTDGLSAVADHDHLTYRASAVGDFSVHPTHWQGSCSPPFIEGLLTAAVAATAVAVTEAVGVAA